MAYAELALGQIRSLRQTAIPRNYEIWYVYATGYNAPLNKIINETLARNGKLSQAESRDQVKTIVDTLLKSTREMRETNKALEERLTLSKSEISNLQQSLEAIRAESLTDPLTGLGNRKYFDRSI